MAAAVRTASGHSVLEKKGSGPPTYEDRFAEQKPVFRSSIIRMGTSLPTRHFDPVRYTRHLTIYRGAVQIEKDGHRHDLIVDPSDGHHPVTVTIKPGESLLASLPNARNPAWIGLHHTSSQATSDRARSFQFARPILQHTLCYRSPGDEHRISFDGQTAFKGHGHRSGDPSKNPEYLLLFGGCADLLTCEHRDTFPQTEVDGQIVWFPPRDVVQTKVIDATHEPVMIKIPAGVNHLVRYGKFVDTGFEGSVIVMEARVDYFDPAVFRENTYWVAFHEK